MERRLSAILVADLVGYSRLIRSNEEATLSELQELREESLNPIFAQHKGRIVKEMGDGVLVEFTSVVDAVRAATQFQQALAERNKDRLHDRKLEFRVGINMGDIVIDGEDIQGDGVNLAARLEGLAEPGSVCISDAVHDQVRDRLDIVFDNLGERHVKNIDRPIHIWQWSALLTPPTIASTASVAESNSRHSIAVLPFSNMSGDPEQEYFSDGITEDIITDLSKISALFVVGRNTTFTYKNHAVNLQQVARELSVVNLLEGSVRKAGNRVRITAQLIDGKTGGHLWAERYDRELTDIFEVQDEITQEIVSALKIALQPWEQPSISRPQTQNFEAYDLYLRGRRQQRMFTKTSLALAIKLFNKAIEVDISYARAYCGVADCCVTLYQNFGQTAELLTQIGVHSTKALELAPNLAEAHASYGFSEYLKENYDNADQAFARAVELDPKLYEAHFYWGRCCVSQGESEEAARHLFDAMETSPHELDAPALLVQVLSDLGRLDELKEVSQITIDNAARIFEQDPTNVRACLGSVFGYYRLGDIASVKKQINLAQALDPEDAIINYNMACIYSLIEDKKNAIHFLERAIERGMTHGDWIENDSDLDGLRSDPKFIALLKSLG